MLTLRLLLLTLGLCFGLLHATPALACKCALPSFEAAREDASALFEGRVTAIEQQGDDPGSVTGKQRVTLAVVRTWKSLDRVERVEVFTNGSSAACGYMFAKDASYLVYAREDEGKLWVSLCSRTRPLSDATEDLTLLGAGSTPVHIEQSDAGSEPKGRSGADAPPTGQRKEPEERGSKAKSGGCATKPATAFDGSALMLALLALVRRRSVKRS